ncbi:MAG: HU family DNA-binding protein [Syntrophorhabdaceae bacterium]
MTKTEIIEKIAEEVKISKVAAAKAFDVFIGSISGAMKSGDKVTIIGFGTFSVASRKARKGRNPRTGEAIKIAASKTPKFSAGATLKATVNGKAAAKPAKKAQAKVTKKASPAAKPAKATKPAGKSKK